ncbi:hypothetical protein [Acinetobacter bereziniae]|uniref:hypothetical protein n=1 Tax=Acinetobacter bereziniae TaxID=106648 RepID=UPI0018FF3A37|nr:hypothetical protein [Acinetobacter bereziniae]MBJ8554091.1 hypothetical protein [Acinetobacter bereziniae]
MDIYLDHCVMCDYIAGKDNEIVTKIDSLRDSLSVNLPYSPAHIEEIANISKSKIADNLKVKYIKEKLDTISKITRNYEYLPSFNEIRIDNESPYDCMMRVIEDYEQTTGLAEKLQENLFNLRFQVNEQYKIENLFDYPPENIFEYQPVKDELLKFSKNDVNELNNLKNHENDFHRLQFGIDNLVNFLELIGYYPDSQSRSRSNMHDVSHLIYASKADYFITGDKKTRYKAKAIYSFLDLRTKVLDKDEFITLQLKQSP